MPSIQKEKVVPPLLTEGEALAHVNMVLGWLSWPFTGCQVYSGHRSPQRTARLHLSQGY